MQYNLKNLTKILEDGVETKQRMSIEVVYDAVDADGNNLTSEHNKVIALDTDVSEEAVKFAAELEQVLTEPKAISFQEVEVATKDKVIKKVDIEAKIAELQAEPLVEPII